MRLTSEPHPFSEPSFTLRAHGRYPAGRTFRQNAVLGRASEKAHGLGLKSTQPVRQIYQLARRSQPYGSVIRTSSTYVQVL
jgi:hypothetical protein